MKSGFIAVLPALTLFLLSFQRDVSLLPPGERMAADHFRRETDRAAARALGEIRTLADWQARRETYRHELLDMLGLSPLPPRTDLRATITGRLETASFTVEKLYFQSLPGLYVTASLYLPKGVSAPAPTVLYVCGHSQTKKDGVAYGTKVAYQHHPAWLAEHGYVAMILDTLEMGEIEGEHHGTSRRGMWWWATRGYTPAGVETWNAMRALDYLATRPEVDMQRLGLTGRSGGGAYSWYLAAVDDRPSVVIPVAGIADLETHVVDGCIDRHCDCMFMANVYGWDFARLAAMTAPRPLLLANSDKDDIFPLDGVQRVHREVKRIYRLHGAEDRLGLLITEGNHADTQDLQVPTFRWLNRWLKKETGPLAEPALKRFTAEQLRVFATLPADERNTRIHETFVPRAAPIPPPATRADWEARSAAWRQTLRERVFRHWPAAAPAPAVRALSDEARPGGRARVIEFAPDESWRLQLTLLLPDGKPATALAVHVLDEEGWARWAGEISAPPAAAAKALQQGTALALVAPRGIGPTAWRKEKETTIRRRFLLLGQSLEGLRVWDARAALAALRTQPELRGAPIALHGAGEMAVIALLAGLFEEDVARFELDRLPATLANGPSLPNALRFFDLPQLVALGFPRAIHLSGSAPADWRWSADAAKAAGGKIVFQE